MEKIKCPHCGYVGKPADFTYIYESTLYFTRNNVVKSTVEKPFTVICPKCRKGFYLEDAYKRFKTQSMD